MFTLEGAFFWSIQVGKSCNVTRFIECKQSIKRQQLNIVMCLNISVYQVISFIRFTIVLLGYTGKKN